MMIQILIGLMQWATLNGIAVNVISHLLGSYFIGSIYFIYCYIMGSWDHSVNCIRYGVAQSDPIKRTLLYFVKVMILMQSDYCTLSKWCFWCKALRSMPVPRCRRRRSPRRKGRPCSQESDEIPIHRVQFWMTRGF